MTADTKPRIRIYTTGIEMDAVVLGTVGRKCIGSGFGCDGGRDMDFEYGNEAERDAEFSRLAASFAGMFIRVEKLQRPTTGRSGGMPEHLAGNAGVPPSADTGE